MTYTQILAFKKWFERIGHRIVADYWRKELNKPCKIWKVIKEVRNEERGASRRG